jgi:hypothetical protein
MKRLSTQLDASNWLDVVNVVVPIEILITVCTQNWDLSCLFICVSRAFVYELTRPHILCQIVEHALRGGHIYPWLLYSMSETLLPHHVVRIDNLTSSDHVFVTGGAVAQLVYDKQWESDIDVWATHSNVNINLPRSNAVLDLITNEGPQPCKMGYHQELHKCLASFDLSVVQQGYYLDTGVGYCTPLSLYTRHTGIIVVIPDNICVKYTGGFMINYRVTVWHYIHKHEDECDPDFYGNHEIEHNGYYHACILCKNCRSSGHISFRRWQQRVCKFESRFPDFRWIYTRAFYTEMNEHDNELCEQVRNGTAFHPQSEEYGRLKQRLSVLDESDKRVHKEVFTLKCDDGNTSIRL